MNLKQDAECKEMSKKKLLWNDEYLKKLIIIFLDRYLITVSNYDLLLSQHMINEKII